MYQFHYVVVEPLLSGWLSCVPNAHTTICCCSSLVCLKLLYPSVRTGPTHPYIAHGGAISRLMAIRTCLHAPPAACSVLKTPSRCLGSACVHAWVCACTAARLHPTCLPHAHASRCTETVVLPPQAVRCGVRCATDPNLHAVGVLPISGPAHAPSLPLACLPCERTLRTPSLQVFPQAFCVQRNARHA